MSRDLYSSLSGAASAWSQIELIAHNIANVDTTGFKASRITFSLGGIDSHPLGQAYAESQGESIDPSDGVVVPDGIQSHLALQGDGYFVVQQAGQQLFTRDGRFSVGTDGRLVDSSGRELLGENGPITLEPGESFQVEPDGRLIGERSGEIDRIRIETAERVRPIGGNDLVPEGLRWRGSASVVQGGLERSNVDPMRAMVDLVAASRAFEAYQQAMRASDELDARLNQIGG